MSQIVLRSCANKRICTECTLGERMWCPTVPEIKTISTSRETVRRQCGRDRIEIRVYNDVIIIMNPASADRPLLVLMRSSATSHKHV